MGDARNLCDTIALARAWPFSLMEALRTVVTSGAVAATIFWKPPFWLAFALIYMWAPRFGFDYCRRPRAVRAARIRRGLCLTCSYDLRGNVSGVCPECGIPVAE